MTKLCIRLIFLLCLVNNIFADKSKWDDDKSGWSELQLAIYYKENDNVFQIINNNIELLNEGRNGTNAIEIAIRVNNEFAVYELLNRRLIFDLDELLIFACLANSNIQIIEYLCNFGANVNYVRENGYNCLMAATSFSSLEIMKYLLDQNIDVNIGRRFSDGYTALTLAIYNSAFEKILLLLGSGANTFNINNTGETAYDYAKSVTQRLEIEQKEKLLNLFR